MSRQLIDALLARVARWERDPASDAVLGPAVDDELERLTALPGFPQDLEARYAVGLVLWCRCVALGPDGEFALSKAVDMLAPIAHQLPYALPEELRHWVRIREQAVAESVEAMQEVDRYYESRNLETLDRAITLLTNAAHRLDDTRPATATFLFDLGNLFWIRYQHTGLPIDLFITADAITKATAADESGYLLGRDGLLNDQASQVYAVWERDGSLETLQAAVDLQRCAFRLATTDRPSQAASLAYLVQMGYERTGRRELLDDAIATSRWAVAQEPANGSALLNLAYALTHRARADQDTAVAHEAVDHARRAVGAAPAAHRGRALQILGNAQRVVHTLAPDPALLAEAVETLRQAVAETDPEDPDHVRRLMALADALRAAASDESEAMEAVALARRVVAATAPSTPEFHVRRAIVVTALVKQHELTRDPAVLAEAVSEGRAALEVTPSDSVELPSVVRALVRALGSGRVTADRSAVLQEAVDLVRDCIGRIAPSHPEADALVGDLAALEADHADAQLLRYVETPDDAALDRIIASAEAGTAATSTALTTLCEALRLRFEAYSEVTDLDRSIEAGLRAIDELTDQPEPLSRAQVAVGFSLRLRYERTGHLASLDDAIELLRRSAAAAETQPGSAFLAARLNMLGNARWERSMRAQDAGLLESAIADLRRSVELGSAAGAVDPGHLSNLALAVRTQYETTHEPALVDELVEILQRAVRESRPDNNRLPVFRSNLAIALTDRYGRDGDLADLDAAIAVHHEVLAAPTAGPAFRAGSRTNLAHSLVQRYRRTGDRATLGSAFAEYRAIVGETSHPPIGRCQAAFAWGALAAEVQDWAEALEAYAAAIAQLPLVAPRSLDRADQEHGLRQFTRLGPDAAAAALQLADAASDPAVAGELRARAVELLDQSRGILLTHQLESRSDLSRLRTHAPTLATRFENLLALRNQPT